MSDDEDTWYLPEDTSVTSINYVSTEPFRLFKVEPGPIYVQELYEVRLLKAGAKVSVKTGRGGRRGRKARAVVLRLLEQDIQRYGYCSSITRKNGSVERIDPKCIEVKFK